MANFSPSRLALHREGAIRSAMEASLHSRYVKAWIHACILLVFCMVVIGGLTRLTESGLSIVEWKLVSGILPPLTESAWQEELEAYRASPQYQQVNRGMSLGEFKEIFWLEYIHRLLGRLVGLMFIVPLAFFWVTKRLTPTLAKKMLGLSILVGIQGAVGWYMVKSGLVDVPWVSPYRLAFHLGLAVVIFSLLLHVAYTTHQVRAPAAPHPLFRLSFFTTALVFIQILLGALVAGLDAGYTYNTWPLMDGALIPAHLATLEPFWRNFFEHIPLVQFQHRWFAFAVLTIIIYQHFCAMVKFNDSRITRVCAGITILAVLQVALGIVTLLHAVPVMLGTLHQAVALVLIGFCVWLNHVLYYCPESTAHQDAGDRPEGMKNYDDKAPKPAEAVAGK